MKKYEKTLGRVLRGTSDRNIRFSDLLSLLIALGFNERVRGDHHILTREGVREILNIQPGPSGAAKPYQVKQVRLVITAHGLGGAK